MKNPDFDFSDDDYMLAENYRTKLSGKDVVTVILAITTTLGGLYFAHKVESKISREKANERNVSYILEVDTNTKFYDWCSNATNIGTLVCIVEGKAYLYEFDSKQQELETGVYKVIDANGEYMYIPLDIAWCFETHESAKEYAKLIVGEENIICTNYPKHNSAKTRKLVP